MVHSSPERSEMLLFLLVKMAYSEEYITLKIYSQNHL